MHDPFSPITQRLNAIDILGTPLVPTSYEELAEHCQSLLSRGGVSVVNMTNTQVVTMRRHHREFREITRSVDLFIPDGMPLVWCLNQRGAGLSDRVYGPTFMRRVLQKPAGITHYLLGGSEEIGRRLRERFPETRFVGSYHGRCDEDGRLAGDAEKAVIEEINHLSPDFIWIGLGAPKQDLWIHKHKEMIKRGVIFAVGFAFDVNAGSKKDAPDWMQRLGITWFFRLLSEPRRLLGRYLKYNTLFLYYLLTDGLKKK